MYRRHAWAAWFGTRTGSIDTRGDASGDFLKNCLLQGFGAPWIKPLSPSYGCGTTLIELVQPKTEGPSIWTEIQADQDGKVLHHIYPNIHQITSTEYEAQIAKYEKEGLQVALMINSPMGRASYFDARDTLGCFIEVLENIEQIHSFNVAMYHAHLNWDGTKLLRNAEMG